VIRIIWIRLHSWFSCRKRLNQKENEYENAIEHLSKLMDVIRFMQPFENIDVINHQLPDKSESQQLKIEMKTGELQQPLIISETEKINE